MCPDHHGAWKSPQEAACGTSSHFSDNAIIVFLVWDGKEICSSCHSQIRMSLSTMDRQTYCWFSTSHHVMVSAWQHVYETFKRGQQYRSSGFSQLWTAKHFKSVFEIALTHQQWCLVCVGVSVPHGRMAHHNTVITAYFHKEVELLKLTWEWILLVFFPLADMANWPCVTIFLINFTPPKMQLEVWSHFHLLHNVFAEPAGTKSKTGKASDWLLPILI